MKLSTRLALAMVGLVLFTAMAVGLLTYRDLEAAIVPRALERVDTRVAQRAADLEAYVQGARSDLLAQYRAPAVQGIIRAHMAGGYDPVDGTAEASWIGRSARRYAGEIESKGYLQIRIIAADDGGREIMRVDRSGRDGEIRIVPDEELQRQGGTDYFKRTIESAKDAVYISPVELGRNGGTIGAPHVPVMYVATALQTEDGKPFGIFVINIDMRPAFERIRASALPDTSVYLVNESGDYLVHPDRTRQFGFEYGRTDRLQDEFPELANALDAPKIDARLMRDAIGQRIAAAVAVAQFSDLNRAITVETIPHSVVMRAAYTARRSIIVASTFAVIVAVAVAILLSRSLLKSLVQVTAGVQAFGRGQQMALPTSAPGEIGVVARALVGMAGEIKAGSAKLREYARRERFYIAAVKSTNYAFITVDPMGTITAWNPGAERLFGFTADEAAGQLLSIIIPQDKREEARLNREKIHRRERVGTLKTVRITKDGKRIDVVIDGSPIISHSGKLLGSSITVRDLTAEKIAQEMFRLAVESCPSGMIMVDRSGQIVMVNTETERLFGYHRDELINRPVDLLVPERLRPQHARHCEAFAGAPETRRMGAGRDLFGRRKDGSEFPVEVGLNPIKIRDGMLILSVIVDISERRQNERLKDEFVSTVSHELRTPLTSIAGSLGLLTGGATGVMPEPTMRLLRIAHKNSERLVRLINDILDIEKIESGKVVFDLKRVEAGAIVDQAVEGNRGYAEGFGVRVRFDPAAAASYVRADPDRLVQVLTNLLSNAIKFSPREGEVVVSIDQRADAVRITVRDHGLGIPENFKPRVFEKFAQADASDARQKGGTGLGLSIVKQIVTYLGGTVGFDTPADGGTAFHVDLPRWELSAGAGGGGGEAASSAGPHGQVLICDGDAAVAWAIANRLETAGFTTDIALTAREALAKARARAYRSVLVDLQLPDCDGISLIQDLRSQPRYQNTPIVVISADAARGRDDIRSSSLAVLDWLNKPIDIAQLVSVLDRPLARGAAQRPHVLHIDDDPSVLSVVAEAVGPTCAVTSVASIADARVALAAQRFDFAVVDLVLSQASGLDLLPDLRDQEGNAIPVILYSARAANGHNAAQVQAALTKSHKSIDHLILTLRKHTATRHVPAPQDREVA
ncbi:MAG: hypothetical protein QOG83_3295 [Alphaproteobacteria bacterium]|nr:hypothetical protein [Alphaproteobacteria bacterium]